MSGFMGSETVVGSHKLFIGSRLNLKYVSEPSDMDSNLLIRNFPGGMGGWRIYFRRKPFLIKLTEVLTPSQTIVIFYNKTQPFIYI